MKPKSWKQGLSQTTENYASRTSIHGIGYIFDWDLSFADRLLWTIFTLSFLALAILLTSNNWTQWQENQVKTLPMPKSPKKNIYSKILVIFHLFKKESPVFV